eukprot:g4700.t2
MFTSKVCLVVLVTFAVVARCHSQVTRLDLNSLHEVRKEHRENSRISSGSLVVGTHSRKLLSSLDSSELEEPGEAPMYEPDDFVIQDFEDED